MSKQELKTRTGATPGKLALVAVLAVVLVVVLIVQFSGGEQPPAAGRTADKGDGASPARSRRPPSEHSPARNSPAKEQPSPPRPRRLGKPWPRIPAEEAKQYDPFAVTELFVRFLAPAPKNPETAAAKSQAELEQLQQWNKQLQDALAKIKLQGVTAILENENGAAAAIGDEVVRVGDIVVGFRVIEITKEGITLEPVTPD